MTPLGKLIWGATGVAVLMYFNWPTRAPLSSGALPEPTQETIQRIEWSAGEFNYWTENSFYGRVRVLSRCDYWMGNETKLSPTDLVLAWGDLALRENYEQITVSQKSRWYFYEYPLTMKLKNLSLLSSNVHIIPAPTCVGAELKKVRAGDIIDVSGYLVNVGEGDGPEWASSLKRNDTGAGACEVFYLMELTIVPRK